MFSKIKKSVIGKIHGIPKDGQYFDTRDTAAPPLQDIKRAVKRFKKLKQKPTYIVGIGYSGCAFGTVLSYLTNVPLVLIRNGHPNREFNRRCYKRAIEREVVSNYYKDIKKDQTWVFVDDLIDSGISFARAYHVMTEKLGLKCLGIIVGEPNDGFSLSFGYPYKDAFKNHKLPVKLIK